MIRFEPGQTYVMRTSSDGDDFTSEYTVVSRTAKFVVLRGSFPDNVRGEHDKRVGVRVWDDVEVASPWGRYAMSPTLAADRPVDPADEPTTFTIQAFAHVTVDADGRFVDVTFDPAELDGEFVVDNGAELDRDLVDRALNALASRSAYTVHASLPAPERTP